MIRVGGMGSMPAPVFDMWAGMTNAERRALSPTMALNPEGYDVDAAARRWDASNMAWDPSSIKLVPIAPPMIDTATGEVSSTMSPMGGGYVYVPTEEERAKEAELRARPFVMSEEERAQEAEVAAYKAMVAASEQEARSRAIIAAPPPPPPAMAPPVMAPPPPAMAPPPPAMVPAKLLPDMPDPKAIGAEAGAAAATAAANVLEDRARTYARIGVVLAVGAGLAWWLMLRKV